MTIRTARRSRLLDVVAVVGMGGPAMMTLASLDVRPPAISITITTLLAAATGTWIAWRRSQQRSGPAAIAFAVIATATIALGNGSLFYGIIWTACLAIGVTFSSSLALWSFTGLLVAVVVTLHAGSGSSLDRTVIEAVVAVFSAGIGAAMTAVLRDSIRVDAALREALDQLRSAHHELSRQREHDRDLVLARERERTARELHDSLGHRLTAIGLSLDYAGRIDDAAAARDELQSARTLVSESLDAMRRLVRAIHPVEIGSLRNSEAFHAVADAFRGTGIAIDVSIEGDAATLDHEHALLLLRFVQEGLTNVVRHSEATTVLLLIVVGEGSRDATPSVHAVLEDRAPGSGLAEVREGFGIRSLRSRAESFGGTIVPESTVTGFRLMLDLPATSAQRVLDLAPAGQT